MWPSAHRSINPRRTTPKKLIKPAFNWMCRKAALCVHLFLTIALCQISNQQPTNAGKKVKKIRISPKQSTNCMLCMVYCTQQTKHFVCMHILWYHCCRIHLSMANRRVQIIFYMNHKVRHCTHFDKSNSGDRRNKCTKRQRWWQHRVKPQNIQQKKKRSLYTKKMYKKQSHNNNKYQNRAISFFLLFG